MYNGIIRNTTEFMGFVDWLPELHEGECYYVSLFARKKYHPSAKNDKFACKRFVATSKYWLIRKIKHLELHDKFAYVNKNGTAVHPNALALYISLNPRSLFKAQQLLLMEMAESISLHRTNVNPASVALSCIQKLPSRKILVDFDFDVDHERMPIILRDIFRGINQDACKTMITRGGFHLIVNPSFIEEEYKCTWYQHISKFEGCDVKGDNLIPVVGCRQGDYVPTFLSESMQSAIL